MSHSVAYPGYKQGGIITIWQMKGAQMSQNQY